MAIRDLRLAAKLSQYELARRSGISRTRITMSECGYAELRPEEEQALCTAVANAIRERVSHFQGQLGELVTSSQCAIAHVSEISKPNRNADRLLARDMRKTLGK